MSDEPKRSPLGSLALLGKVGGAEKSDLYHTQPAHTPEEAVRIVERGPGSDDRR